MRYIKTFELFSGSIGDTIKRKFDEPTEPNLPFKRKLTQEENNKMLVHFKKVFWTDVDSDNKIIILENKNDKKGIYYLTVDDINKLSYFNGLQPVSMGAKKRIGSGIF